MSDQKNAENPKEGIHVEPKSDQPADLAKQMCSDAKDKEKCEAFVERLGEASNNIEPPK